MDSAELRALVQSIALTASGYLGAEETLRSVTVELFSNEQRALLWIELKDPSVEAQLEAAAGMQEVQETYADELEINFRFGSAQDGSSSRAAAVKTLQLAR